MISVLDHRHGTLIGGRGNHDAVVAGVVGHIPQAATAGPGVAILVGS